MRQDHHRGHQAGGLCDARHEGHQGQLLHGIADAWETAIDGIGIGRGDGDRKDDVIANNDGGIAQAFTPQDNFGDVVRITQGPPGGQVKSIAHLLVSSSFLASLSGSSTSGASAAMSPPCLPLKHELLSGTRLG